MMRIAKVFTSLHGSGQLLEYALVSNKVLKKYLTASMSQMAAGSYPARNSHGKWAAYFGGPEILASLGDEIFWRTHVVAAAFSAVLQVSLLVVKSIKSKTLNSQQATVFVLAGNFLNVNGMLAAVSLTGSFIFKVSQSNLIALVKFKF